MPLPKARKDTIIHLESLVDEDGTPIDIRIQKVSVKYIGFDASMRLVQQNSLAREAAYRADQGAKDIDSVTPPEGKYPGTPPHYEYQDADDPKLRVDILRNSEILACKNACLEPTFEEICEAYDADPTHPWDAMGSDFESLVEQITEWSGYSKGGKVMTPEESERFPKGVGESNRRNGGAVRKASSRNR